MFNTRTFPRNAFWGSVVVVVALPIACSSPEPSNTSSSSSSSSASSASSSSSGKGGAGGTGGEGGMAGAGGGSNGPKALECQNAGGICLAQGSCAPAGGTVPAASPGGCFFDDGPAECCVPAAPKMNPMTCADAGGLCAPIGGCLDAGGYFTSTTAGCNMGGSFTCCVPHAQCGEETIECCEPMTVYKASCDNGKLVCQIGMPVPKGSCKVP